MERISSMPDVIYWEKRYKRGGDSGRGSRGTAAVTKARLVSSWADRLGVTSILDIGCGDGHVAKLYDLECDYLGIDPSRTAVAKARRRAPHLKFDRAATPKDAHLSMDVILHLVDDADYRRHLGLLFSADRFVFVYGTNHNQSGRSHVRHRHWTPDVPSGWEMVSEELADDRNAFRVFRRC